MQGTGFAKADKSEARPRCDFV